jgi:hypothetical protein
VADRILAADVAERLIPSHLDLLAGVVQRERGIRRRSHNDGRVGYHRMLEPAISAASTRSSCSAALINQGTLFATPGLRPLLAVAFRLTAARL